MTFLSLVGLCWACATTSAGRLDTSDSRRHGLQNRRERGASRHATDWSPCRQRSCPWPLLEFLAGTADSIGDRHLSWPQEANRVPGEERHRLRAVGPAVIAGVLPARDLLRRGVIGRFGEQQQ